MKIILTALAFASLSLPALAQTAKPKPAPFLPKPSNVTVAITTTAGTIVVELDRIRAPITAGNFMRYVDQKRFDGINFYRRVQTPTTKDLGFIQGPAKPARGMETQPIGKVRQLLEAAGYKYQHQQRRDRHSI